MPRSPAVPWRDHLTPDERAEIAEMDRLKAAWQQVAGRRAGIVNRAIKRAQYRAQHASGGPDAE